MIFFSAAPRECRGFSKNTKKNDDMKATDKSDRILLGICRWVTDRVSENVLIGIFCVGALIAAFAV